MKRKQYDGDFSDSDNPSQAKRHKAMAAPSDGSYSLANGKVRAPANYIYRDLEVVWARLEDFPWWPAQCDFTILDVDHGAHRTPRLPVRWFGEDHHRVDMLTRDRVLPFSMQVQHELESEIKVEAEDEPEYFASMQDAVARQEKWHKEQSKQRRRRKDSDDEDFDPAMYRKKQRVGRTHAQQPQQQAPPVQQEDEDDDDEEDDDEDDDDDEFEVDEHGFIVDREQQQKQQQQKKRLRTQKRTRGASSTTEEEETETHEEEEEEVEEELTDASVHRRRRGKHSKHSQKRHKKQKEKKKEKRGRRKKEEGTEEKEEAEPVQQPSQVHAAQLFEMVDTFGQPQVVQVPHHQQQQQQQQQQHLQQMQMEQLQQQQMHEYMNVMPHAQVHAQMAYPTTAAAAVGTNMAMVDLNALTSMQMMYHHNHNHNHNHVPQQQQPQHHNNNALQYMENGDGGGGVNEQQQQHLYVLPAAHINGENMHLHVDSTHEHSIDQSQSQSYVAEHKEDGVRKTKRKKRKKEKHKKSEIEPEQKDKEKEKQSGTEDVLEQGQEPVVQEIDVSAQPNDEQTALESPESAQQQNVEAPPYEEEEDAELLMAPEPTMSVDEILGDTQHSQKLQEMAEPLTREQIENLRKTRILQQLPMHLQEQVMRDEFEGRTPAMLAEYFENLKMPQPHFHASYNQRMLEKAQKDRRTFRAMHSPKKRQFPMAGIFSGTGNMPGVEGGQNHGGSSSAPQYLRVASPEVLEQMQFSKKERNALTLDFIVTKQYSNRGRKSGFFGGRSRTKSQTSVGGTSSNTAQNSDVNVAMEKPRGGNDGKREMDDDDDDKQALNATVAPATTTTTTTINEPATQNETIMAENETNEAENETIIAENETNEKRTAENETSEQLQMNVSTTPAEDSSAHKDGEDDSKTEAQENVKQVVANDEQHVTDDVVTSECVVEQVNPEVAVAVSVEMKEPIQGNAELDQELVDEFEIGDVMLTNSQEF